MTKRGEGLGMAKAPNNPEERSDEGSLKRNCNLSKAKPVFD
jgi:hypothetical protein